MDKDEAVDLERQADALLRSGRLREAQQKIRASLAIEANSSVRWMKSAAIERALGDLAGALSATETALTHSPLDFMALLSRAHLLEKLGRADAGEAFGRALANKPETDLPVAMTPVIERAQASYEGYVEKKYRLLSGIADDAMQSATPQTKRHIDRLVSNMLRKTRVYHSEPTHFHFPGLPEREFHDREDFPWLPMLEAATDEIAAEFAAVVASDDAELVPYIQYSDDVPLRQWAELNRSRDWTAIHLLRNGEIVEANAKRCPRTLQILDAVPQPAIGGCGPNAMFSLLMPRTAIPPHTGVSNTRLVCHLPLIVPQNCWFRVGATTRSWNRGEAFVFDDTIEHEAANDSDELRVVLIIDLWHPALSVDEQQGVRAILGADRNAFGTSL